MTTDPSLLQSTSILSNPIICQAGDTFAQEMLSWKLDNRPVHSSHSPPLDAGIQSMLLEVYYAVTQAIAEYKSHHSFRASKMLGKIFISSPALEMYHKLLDHPALAEYANRRAVVARSLIGSAVGRAIEASYKARILDGTENKELVPQMLFFDRYEGREPSASSQSRTR